MSEKKIKKLPYKLKDQLTKKVNEVIEKVNNSDNIKLNELPYTKGDMDGILVIENGNIKIITLNDLQHLFSAY